MVAELTTRRSAIATSGHARSAEIHNEPVLSRCTAYPSLPDKQAAACNTVASLRTMSLREGTPTREERRGPATWQPTTGCALRHAASTNGALPPLRKYIRRATTAFSRAADRHKPCISWGPWPSCGATELVGVPIGGCLSQPAEDSCVCSLERSLSETNRSDVRKPSGARLFGLSERAKAAICILNREVQGDQR